MKILIVEDEEKLAYYLERALQEEGFTTEWISNGKEAYGFIQNFHNELDCILLDIFLPDMSGLTICEKARKANIATPILILTAKDKENEKVSGLNTGADDYITKPFSLPELIARIHSHIRRSQGVVTQTITIGNISINTAARKVYCNNKEVTLTLKEYNILHLLATHPNETIDREFILDTIWDRNALAMSNVVDAQVKNLRQKLNDTPQTKIIETIRGIGFRLNK